MVKITVFENRANEYTGFQCLGHTGYADSGKDIVCAAVSALVINTINSLEELTDTEMEVASSEEDGFINCRLEGPLSAGANLLLDAMILGLKNVVSQYGRQYLKLKFKEV